MISNLLHLTACTSLMAPTHTLIRFLAFEYGDPRWKTGIKAPGTGLEPNQERPPPDPDPDPSPEL